ncbi:transposase [Hydrogenimonas sp. SS33]|uniref:transposase n=2 Tax=Hydrogenimonas leucolamina TaxID=2954236 RepID=UPI00336BB2AF
MEEQQPPIKRFTAKKKADIVMDIFQGKTTVAEVSRKYDLTPAAIEEWMEEARAGMENQLRARPKDVAAMYEEKIKSMKEVIGELTLENIALKKYDALFGEEKK